MGNEMERQKFEAHMRLGGYSNHDRNPDGSYKSSALEFWWQGWQARAALSASPAPIETHPCPGMNCGSTDGSHSIECEAETAATYAGGIFVKAAPSGEVEAVEVVGCKGVNCGTTTGDHSPECVLEAYITFGCEQSDLHEAAKAVFDQHQRIVAAKDAEIARLKADGIEADSTFRYCEKCWSEERSTMIDTIRKLRAQLAEKDAELERVRSAAKRIIDRAQTAADELGFMLAPENNPVDFLIRLAKFADSAQLAAQKAAAPVAWAQDNLDQIFHYDRCAVISRERNEDSNYTLPLYAAPAAPQQGVESCEARVIGYTPGMSRVELQLPAGPIPQWLELGETVRLNADRSAQTDAARDVLAERRRQVEAEGWTPEHDDEHSDGQLSRAAAAYALQFQAADEGFDCSPTVFWPWSKEWWKPSSGRQMLVKAGALILAEIERLDRLNPSAQGEKP